MSGHDLGVREECTSTTLLIAVGTCKFFALELAESLPEGFRSFVEADDKPERRGSSITRE